MPRSLEHPHLILVGRHDLPALPEQYQRENVLPLAPNGELTVIEGAGHYPMDEMPLLLAKLIEDFLGANAE